MHRVKRLLGAAEGSWLIFLDVRADFTKGTPNAEWLTAVCNGGGKNEENHRKDEELDWTFRFDWFKGDKEHAELWQNGTFPKEAPASKEQASRNKLPRHQLRTNFRGTNFRETNRGTRCQCTRCQ